MIDDKMALAVEGGHCEKVVELLMSLSKAPVKNREVRQQGLLKIQRVESWAN